MERTRTASVTPMQNNYGIMVAEGRGVPEPNLVEAYAWISLAVENGVRSEGREIPHVGEQVNPDKDDGPRDDAPREGALGVDGLSRVRGYVGPPLIRP